MLKLHDLSKVYRTFDVETTALDGVNIEIAAGDFVAVMGPSGCGKSTLLNIAGLLDSPTRGEYWFNGRNVAGYAEDKLAAIRKANIGFIFQSFNLIDELTVRENIELALIYQGMPARERHERVDAVMDQMGIGHRAGHLPAQLSGGQQQRVAVSRAIVARPKLILADEPTGNLDTAHGQEVMRMLQRLNDEGTTVVIVTHSATFADYAKRAINLLDGRVVTENLRAAV